MNLKHLTCGIQVKSVDESGVFTGYASIFNNRDSVDDIVEPGAYKESLSSRGLPKLLWQHDPKQPIGVITDAVEDEIGLKITGKLELGTKAGAEAYALLKIGAVSGLSIGYTVVEAVYDKSTSARILKKVILWEVSLVTFPANELAQVTGVKNFEEIKTIRDAENLLRDACGLDRPEAKALLSRLKEIIAGTRDAESEELKAANSLLEKIQN